MPEKETLERAEEDKREGKAPSTQAGEFVKEEMDHIREGKHGAASTKQAIAIGLSKARRAGVDLPPPKKGTHIGEDAQVGGECLPQGTKQRAQEEAVAQTFASDRKCSEAAAAEGGVEEGALTAGETGGQSSWKRGAQDRLHKKRCVRKVRAGRKRAAKKAAATTDEKRRRRDFCGIPPLANRRLEMGHPRLCDPHPLPEEGRDGAPASCGRSAQTECCGIPPLPTEGRMGTRELWWFSQNRTLESHLCQKKAEMGHPRIVAVLTKRCRSSRKAKRLAGWRAVPKGPGNRIRTSGRAFNLILMLNFA